MAITFLFFVQEVLISQSIPDSIQILLNETDDANHAEILNNYAKTIVDKTPELAIIPAQQSLDLAQQFDNAKEEIKALHNIGDSYYYRENYSESEKYYTKALQLSQKIKNQELTALSYYNCAYNYDLLNNLEKARTSYIRAIQLYDSLEDFNRAADLSYILALMLDKQGEKIEALTYYEKAVSIYKKLSLDEDVADIFNSIGTLYDDWGDFEKAIKYYNQSIAIMRSQNNKQGISRVLNNLGLLYHTWGNLEKALDYLEASLEIESDLHDQEGIATSYNNIGIVYADTKNYDLALDYYKKALDIYRNLNDKSGIATALNNLGDLYSELGDQVLAIEMLEQSLMFEKEIADQYGISLAFATLSELYIKTEALDISKKYNDSSFVLAKEIKNAEVLLLVYENYSKINELKGNYKNALVFFKQRTLLSDSIFSQNMLNQLSDIKAKYELEKKDQEIEALTGKEHIRRIVNILAIGGFIIIFVIMLIMFKQIKHKKNAYKILDEQNKQILQSREELIIAKEKAEESDRLKSTFLSNMSHELRTPLNGILGFTDILREEIPEEELRQMAEFIHTSGNRLMDTLNSIIDLSIIESNKMEIEYLEINLHDLVSDKVKLFNASASNKNLELSYEVEDESTLIYSDKKILNNLLNNLIDNAIKYTDQGSVKVYAAVNEKQSETWLRLSVSDTGIGIESDKVKNIYDQFRQGSEGHDRQFEGAGLGLTICKKYVEILGGRISVESKINQGSEFSVFLPVKASRLSPEDIKPKTIQAEKAPMPLPKESTAYNFHITAPRALIVENDEINIAHLVYVLKDICNIDTARNGKDAIAKASTQQFNVILMDINLGVGMNGMDTAKTIKEIAGYESTPIIAVTANAMKGHKEEFLANGCTHYISKPYSAEGLRDLVMEAMNETS